MLSKLTTALLLLATAAPTATLANTHVRIHIKSTAASTAANNTIATATTTAANSTGSLFGNVVAVDPAQYKITACAPQTWVIRGDDRGDNATSIWLDFASINAPGDQVIVSTLNGSQPQVFNVALGGISTKPIAGKAREETVCGDSELVNVQCLDSLLKRQSDAVMRLAITKDGKGYWCSAWFWGNKGHIVTNYHCISKQVHVDKTEFQFGVEMRGCNDKMCEPNACAIGAKLRGKGNVELVKASEALDVAVMQITTDATKYVSKYGYLRMRDGNPVAREPFYLVQHPSGGPKVAPAIVESGKVGIPRLTALYGNKQNEIASLGYMADTEGGSSESPLIGHNDKLVIGLHHLGGCPNIAVASNQLAVALRSRFPDIDGLAEA